MKTAVAVFNRLVELSGLDADDATLLKEALDAVAECKAGKQPERRSALIQDVSRLLTDAGVDERWSQVWLDLARAQDSLVVAEAVEDEFVAQRLAQMRALTVVLDTLDVTVDIDLCVVRSHEYYTGIAFEIDVFTQNEMFVEVGGGGRYDRLVGHFVPKGAVQRVPSTGFAFGVQRLVHLLDRLELLDAHRSLAASISLHPAAAQVLLVTPPTPAGYLSGVRAAEQHRNAGRAVDIYLGVPDQWRAYAGARGIVETQSLFVTED